jgi:hypothetical protein
MMIHEDLLAVPVMTEYNHTTKVGRVALEGLGCTDMTGVVRFFKRIDPDVRVIETRNDDGVDTVYCRDTDGAWIALDGPSRRRIGRVAPH